jgi:hypothetical protein
MTQFLVNLCVRSAGSAGGRAVTTLRHSPIAHQVAVALLDDVALMDATLALAEDRFVALTARSQDRPWRAAKGRFRAFAETEKMGAREITAQQ